MATDLQSPVGSSVVEAAEGRARRSAAYRGARAEYERIRALREVSPIAAHLRERRFELGLTQEEVAKAADTSHSAVSRLEKGTHIPQLPTLQRIAAVLDEELLVCFQRTVDGEVEREFAAVACRAVQAKRTYLENPASGVEATTLRANEVPGTRRRM